MAGSCFVAFDVETPNSRNSRMSAIGVAVVEDGRVTETFDTLVNPESGFDPFNTWLTGISEELVQNAPTFPELWPRLEPMLARGVLVAHNAPFDLGVLRRCLQGYGIFWRAQVPYLCTVQMGRRLLPGMSHKLDALCAHYAIPLDHHRAGSDSLACAGILLRYLEAGADPAQFLRAYTLFP